jgi:hypothetical protein
MQSLLTTVFFLSSAFVLGATPALADDVGIEVTVHVTDVNGDPIKTAVVRHSQEQERHRVNTETGKWKNKVLYLPNGDEIVFEKGMELEFEVSAPGYNNSIIGYVVRKRKNVVPAVLEKMDFDIESDDDLDDPVIQFGRDKPID